MYKVTVTVNGFQFDSSLLFFVSSFLLYSCGSLNVNGPHWLIYFMLHPKLLELFVMMVIDCNPLKL